MKTTLTLEKRGLCAMSLRDLEHKLVCYFNTLPLHQYAGIDHAFCEEALEVLLNLLDQVEATLPEPLMIENAGCQFSQPQNNDDIACFRSTLFC
ncbi:hypothetical protein [Candidatus Regiella insecticola]|nr:hypothetical protein [Candidatus Regiella insecticola]